MDEKLLLQDLVVLLAKKAEITQKDADRFYREMYQLILECIYQNDIVKIKDFGTFKLVSISSRESIDVNTGDKIEIPSHFRMSFSPDKTLKELVNKPFAQFESVVLEEGVVFNEPEESDDDDDSQDEPVDEIANEVETITEDISEGIESELENSEESVIKDNKSEADTAPSVDKPNEITSNKEEVARPLEKVDVAKRDTPSRTISEIISRPSTRIERKQDVDKKVEEKVQNPISRISDIHVEQNSEKRINKDNTDTEIPKETPPIATVKKEREYLIDRPKPVNRVERKEKTEPVVIEPPKPKVDIVVAEVAQVEVEEIELAPADEKIFENAINTKPDSVNDINYNGVEDADDYSYENFEKEKTKSSDLRKRLPIIAFIVIVVGAGIYLFGGLFTQKHSFEYQISRNHRLTLTDTLPYLDEQPVRRSIADTIVRTNDTGNEKSNTVSPVVQKATQATPEVNNTTSIYSTGTDGISEAYQTDLDALVGILDSSNASVKNAYQISDKLEVNVVNKAEVYRNSIRKKKSETTAALSE